MMRENTRSERLSLDGTWTLELAGKTGAIQVPGAWEVQEFPDVEGVAYYRRSFDVPVVWANARVDLCFGAVSYLAEVFINDQPVGTHEGLWTSFAFDVTHALRPGESNTIEVRIIKPADEGDRFPYREVLVGFIPYVSTTFGGIWQHVELVAHHEATFSDLHVAAELEGTIRIHGMISDGSGTPVTVQLRDPSGAIAAEHTFQPDGDGAFAGEFTAPDVRMWSPDDPTLYTLLLQTDGAQAERRIGFRRLWALGEALYLNDAPIFLRGVLSWGWDERTLAPTPTDDQIRAEFRRLRGLGFNLYKLCLYVPPPNVFRIADEEGMLLWLELPLWLPRLNDHLRAQAEREYADILARVHHHPSVVLVSLGCELSADHADTALLQRLNALARGATCGALVCENSGSGEAYGGASTDDADFYDYHFYADLHHFIPLCDHFRRDWRPARPWIFGEFCDSDDYRDPTELPANASSTDGWWRSLVGKDGGLHRWAYPEQQARVEALDLPFSHAEIMRRARRTSYLVRKTILEKVRARRDMGGYVITGLRDTPITTSGMFDDLGRFKYELEAPFTHFNDADVLLLETGRARVWQHGGDRPARVDRFNHWAGSRAAFIILLAQSGTMFHADALHWTLTDPANALVQAGVIPLEGDCAPGTPRDIAAFTLDLPQVETAQIYTLRVTLSGERQIQNEWQLYSYSKPTFERARLYDPAGLFDGAPGIERIGSLNEAGDGVVVASACTPELLTFVQTGGRATVMQSGEGALPVARIPFWRESIKLIYDHPVMNSFPHENFTGTQFYHLANDAAFQTDAVSAAVGAPLIPILTRLDARLFFETAYLAEARVGAGRMIISTLRFFGGAGDQVRGLDNHPAGAFLLSSLIDHLDG